MIKMADSITLPFALYRLTAATDTEASIANDESVGADYGITDQDSLGVVNFNFVSQARRTDIPAPQNLATLVPDTGITAPVLKIGFKVNEKISDNRKAAILSVWSLEPKTVRGVFPYGRFGIRNNAKPWFNLQPTIDAGWKIIEVDFDDILQYGGNIDVMVTLQFGGIGLDTAMIANYPI